MKKIIYSILIIIWMAFIFILSNQPASDSTKLSDGFIETTIGNIYKVINKNVSENKLIEIKSKYTHLIRKMAHFTIYLILGLLTTLLINEYNISKKQTILLSILICFIYASSDEIHQLFVEGRSGEIKDILIDTCGSTISTYLICKKKSVK